MSWSTTLRNRSHGIRPAAGLGALLWTSQALAAPVDLVRQDLTDSTCMDGTPAAFYYDRGAISTNTWVVILQGSNLCSNFLGDEGVEAGSVSECVHWCFANEASRTMPLDLTGQTDDGQPGQCDLPHASSANWARELTKGSLFDNGIGDNPIFADAQKIYIRSCSGDGWMGNATDVRFRGPVATPLRSFNFHGKKIINEVFDVLVNTGIEVDHPTDENETVTAQLTDGDLLLFGGESRGAFGAWGNVDRVCTALTGVLPALQCRGITASYLPGMYKPKWREDPRTFQPVPTIDFKQWVDVRKRRYRFQRIKHSDNCVTRFPEAMTPLNPVTPYHLDPDDLSQDMCYTDLGLLLSMSTPTFVSFNRYDNIEDYDWSAGCDPSVSPPLRGGPDCFNNQLVREAGIRAIADRLPASFVSYFAASERHLYLIADDCPLNNGDCWTERNWVGLSSSDTTDSLSKADVLEDWIQGGHAGEVFWDLTDRYPFP